MQDFVVTFGVKYSREPHPKLGYVDPRGVIKVTAENETEARELIFQIAGSHWAFIYPVKEGAYTFGPQFYPSGILAEITAENVDDFNVQEFSEMCLNQNALLNLLGK